MATSVNVSDEKQAFIGLLGKNGVIVSEASNASSSLEDVEIGKRRRGVLFRKTAPWLMILLAVGALGALVAFEIIRSNELQKMRMDVDGLQKDVEVLKQRLQDEDLIDDLKAFEEEVYAESHNGHRFETYPGAHHMGLDDLDDMDDDDEDDDDDDDPGASGDDDYDISYDIADHTGSRDTNHHSDIMPTLTDKTSHDELPPSPTDDARGFHDAPEELLDVGEYRRRRAEEAKREKREISGATRQGVPILEESYAHRRNRTDGDESAFRLHESLVKYARHEEPMLQGRGWEKDDEFRHQPAVYARRRVPSNMDYATLEREAPVTVAPPRAPPTSGVFIRKSRVMNTGEDKSKAYRQIVKKSSLIPNSQKKHRYQEQVSPVETRLPLHRRRPHRIMRKNLEMMGSTPGHVQTRHRPMAAAHFSGDTTKYEQGKHEHYNGNGRLRHPDGVFTDWEPASWVGALGMDKNFRLSDGSVTIKDSGLYFIYAQVHYLDEHDTNGYRVYRNDEPLLQCTTMTHSTDRVVKSNTCYTGAASHLNAGDRLSLRDLGGMRYALFEPAKSFFGIVKLGDARIK